MKHQLESNQIHFQGKRIVLAVFLVCFSFCVGTWADSSRVKTLRTQDVKYVQELARDTYRCIDFFTDSQTGLPLDNTKFIEDVHTSITNIGFYIASVVVACELGFEKRDIALQKLRKLFAVINQLPKWKNFPYSWNHTTHLTKNNDSLISTVDLGNYYAGIIVARQYFPELKEECDRQLKVNWNDLYDAREKLLYGSYDAGKNAFGEWHYGTLGSESRLASFLAIAMSGVPLESWDALDRTLEKRYEIEYLKPGWQGGGLFMAFLAGMFIDERGTLPGLSAGNFAKAQMIHKEKIGSPVWGWSASDSPQYGYLGWQAIRDDVVTPHASALAISFYPEEVVKNLRKFDELGVRPHHLVNGTYYDFGFRDAYDIKTGMITENYLILDQTMLFLSLANFLSDRILIRKFESYPPIKTTLSRIKEYASRSNKEVEFPVSLSKKFASLFAASETNRPKYKVLIAANSPLTNVGEWQGIRNVILSTANLEMGKIQDEKDLSANLSFLRSSKFLYVRCKLLDQSIQLGFQGENICKGDVIEIYVNPDNQGLVWGDPKDYQIGVTPPDQNGIHQKYAWFQKRPLTEDEVKVVSHPIPGGYDIVIAISWKFLGVENPRRGCKFGLSVAVNDVDADSFETAKVNWFSKSESGKIYLPVMILE